MVSKKRNMLHLPLVLGIVDLSGLLRTERHAHTLQWSKGWQCPFTNECGLHVGNRYHYSTKQISNHNSSQIGTARTKISVLSFLQGQGRSFVGFSTDWDIGKKSACIPWCSPTLDWMRDKRDGKTKVGI